MLMLLLQYMKELENKIIEEGKILEGDILKIDNFLNHQIDTKLLDEIGKEFYRLFKEYKPEKIFTIEASGIAVACATARYFDYIPVVFAKKNMALNMSGDTYVASVISYTRNSTYNIRVAKDYLKSGDRVLILDDFLANGEAIRGLIDICNEAGCIVVGCGAVVSKSYQSGEKKIKDLGYDVKALARIKSLKDGVIEFEEE